MRALCTEKKITQECGYFCFLKTNVLYLSLKSRNVTNAFEHETYEVTVLYVSSINIQRVFGLI